MKAQYVGDIGDFGKVLLLKHLARLGFKIGVNWEMTRDDDGPDGNHRDYVYYRGVHCLCCCDIELLAGIAPLAIMLRGQRRIGDLEDLIRTFSPGAVFYNEFFDDGGKREMRSREAFERLTGREIDLVFIDPDNGLADGRPISAKHIYLKELESYWNRRKSLLIYHHLPQRRPAEPVIGRWAQELRKLEDSHITHFRFRRGTGRVYFLCVQPVHMSLISRACLEPALVFEPLLSTKADWAKRHRSKERACNENHGEWFTPAAPPPSPSPPTPGQT